MNRLYDFEARKRYYLERIMTSKEICESNKKAITDFLKFCASIEHPKGPLSAARINIYVQRLYYLATWLKKDFHEATKEDLVKLADYINHRPISQETKNLFFVSLKKFYHWYEGEMTYFPKKIAWLHTLKVDSKVKPEDLITAKEALAMIDAARNLRDKAIIAIIHEGGFRIGEVASMQVKSVVEDSKGCILTAPSGKTGQVSLRLVMVNYLTDWLAIHPRKNEPEAPLFCSLTRKDYGEPMKYEAARVQLKKIAKRAGITKRVYHHLFRHSSITDDFRRGMSTKAVQERHHIKDPKTLEVYTQLSQKDNDDAYLRSRGLVSAIQEDSGKEWFKCPRCYEQNAINTRYCAKCGAPLTIAAAVSIDEETKYAVEGMKEVHEFMDWVKKTGLWAEFKKTQEKRSVPAVHVAD